MVEGLENNCSAQWSAFAEQYRPLILWRARKSGLKNQTDLEELQQRVLIELYRQFLRKSQPEREGIGQGKAVYDRSLGSFRGWISHLSHLQSLQFLREKFRDAKRTADPSLTEDESETGRWERLVDESVDDVAESIDRRNLVVLVDTALANLTGRPRDGISLRQNQIYRLYVLEDRDPREVADVLDVSPNVVYLAKNRVGPLLRDEMGRLLGEELAEVDESRP